MDELKLDDLKIDDLKIDEIISSEYQTKNWRKKQIWYKNGKSNECEKYQINNIEKIKKIKINKTNDRINIEKLIIDNYKNPIKNNDGYEYTENFDGKIIINNNIYYFNLKFVCDKGGAQTRTLREVYHFIKYQLDYLVKHKKNNIYFINILDGDTSFNSMNKFLYLLNKDKYLHIKKNVFINDLYHFQEYILQ